MLTRVVTFLSGGKPRPDAPPPAPPSGPSSGAGPSSSSSRAGLALALPAYPPAFAPGLGVLSSPLGLPGAYIESGAPAATPRGFFDHAARRAAARAPPPTASPSPAASTARAESPTLHRPTSPLLSLYVSPSGAYVPSSKPDAASTSPYTETPPVLSPSSPSSARSPPTMYTSQPSSSMTFGGAPASMVAENFPLAPPEAPVDMYEDEALTPLEKIYIFSRSEATFHRIFILHHLPAFLEDVTPAEAVEYVLPLLPSLAVDEDDHVKEALASELPSIVWWFVTHCQVVEDENAVPEQAEQAEEIEDAPATPIALSVQAFTPILGTLLLSSNAMVSGPARHTVVDLLARLRTAGEAEAAGGTPDAMFGAHERRLLEDELLEQVVIGMGRLDYAYAAEHVPDSPAADPDDMDIDAAPSPIESVSEGAASAPASASTSPELSMHASARPSPPATAHSSPGAALQMQLHAQLAADPLRVALPLSAPPTPAGEWAVALSTTPAGERPPWALGLPLPPRDPWNVALPPTPAGEPGAPAPHPATPAGERPPWDVALPPTPAGGESWWAGGSPALRLTGNGTFASPEEVNPYFPMMPPVGSPVITSPSSSDSQTPVGTPIADNLTPLPAAAAGARAVAASALFSPLSDPSPSPSVPVLSPRSDSSLVSSAFPSPLTPPDPVVPVQPVYVVAKDDGPVSMEDDTTPTDDLSSAAAVASVGENVEEAPVEESAGLDVEQAAVGRLSSMSLIAAVTASGPLRDDTKLAFAEEVERIGRDPVYWVRREAAYAVGALVRVLPLEVAQLSMLPLLRDLALDGEAWHVRHASLFAVGPLLARLSPADRRSVALEVLLPLAADATSLVRAGVVEVLGEAIHCFHEDEHGPPDELVRLFLGREEDKRFWEDWLQRHGKLPPRQRPPSPAQIAAATSVVERLRLAALAESPPTFFDELSRPLLCAFNFPAVALTLGAARWPELRGTYLTLARSADAKIRRTLAASTGELARIIGAEHARTDVLGVWRDAVRYADAAVRLKAIEALEALLGAVDATDRVALVRTLDEVWEPCLRGFREREVVAQTFTALVGLLQAEAGLLGSLVRKALIDDVAAVREAAITAVPTLFGALGGRRDVRRQILDDIGQLAHHESYRKRMTYVACQQALVFSDEGADLVTEDDFWRVLMQLGTDPIVNVRIGVARLVGIICDRFYRESVSIPGYVLDLVVRLVNDTSRDVRAFVSVEWRSRPPLPPPHERADPIATFSRPPPPPPTTAPTQL